jgi:hypothetical protein
MLMKSTMNIICAHAGYKTGSPATETYSILDTIIYETPAEYPAIHGGNECGAGVRRMESPSMLFRSPAF